MWEHNYVFIRQTRTYCCSYCGHEIAEQVVLAAGSMGEVQRRLSIKTCETEEEKARRESKEQHQEWREFFGPLTEAQC